VVEPWLGADGFTVTRGTDFQCESFSAQGRVQVIEKRGGARDGLSKKIKNAIFLLFSISIRGSGASV
jgi:hypothetical protein